MKAIAKKKTSLVLAIVTILIISTVPSIALVWAEPGVIRFRLLAVERYFDSTNMKEGGDLINELLNYQNWDNSTSPYVSHIHLLSMRAQADLPPAAQPFYRGQSTKANVESEIKNFLGQAVDEEIVIFYYCGHGGHQYLSLDTSISHTELTSWLSWGGLPDAYVNVILDTCHSGSWINDGAGPGVLGTDRNVLAACKSAQSAWCWGTHTAFTDHGLIPGFGAATDANTDGWISVEEVFNYAAPVCTAYAAGKGKTQEPVSWYDICTGNIPLVQRDTAKPFPDFAYPTTTVSIGNPKHIVGPNTYVTPTTQIDFIADDSTCPTTGIEYIQIKVEGMTFTVYSPHAWLALNLPDGPHTFYYHAKDNAGNVEPQKSLTVIYDSTPPTTTLSIGTPQYVDGPNVYVTSATPFDLTATDTGSGVAHTYYKIDFFPWQEGTSFTLTGPDGTYPYSWYSVDNLGNTETTNSGTVILDNTPPTTALIVGDPKYIHSGNLYVASFTPLSLLATDAGSGVAQTTYRIYSGSYDSGWLTYSGSFTLDGLVDDTYHIEYYSTDNLGNVEPIHTDTVILDTKKTMAGWAKSKIQQLKDDVAASSVHPRFKWLANVYLKIALQEMDKAIEDIQNNQDIQANCHLSRAIIYVRRFSMLIDAFSLTEKSPVLAQQWQQKAQEIVDDITTSINAS